MPKLYISTLLIRPKQAGTFRSQYKILASHSPQRKIAFAYCSASYDFIFHERDLDLRIHEAQDFLMNNLSEAPSNEDLTYKVHMSKRNLTRLFKNTTGITIGEYLQKLRVEKAVALLSNGHKVQMVAAISFVVHLIGNVFLSTSWKIKIPVRLSIV